PWDPDFRKRLEDLFPGRDLDNIDIETEMTDATLEKLKNLCSSFFSDPFRTAIQSARNREGLEAELQKALDYGKRVTFQILRSYKGVKPQVAVIDLWTDFSDCDVRFIKGE